MHSPLRPKAAPRPLRGIAWLMLSLLAVPAAARAATYHVGLTGSDTNPGTVEQPFRTIAHGASVLVPGDTLLVHVGTYEESFPAGIPAGNSWDEPVTIAVAPGEAATILPPAGSDRVFTFASGNVHHVIIRGFVLDASDVTYDAVKVTWGSAEGGSHHVRLEDCEVKNSPAQGILVTGDDHGVRGNEFIGLSVHDNGSTDFDHGLYISTEGNLVDGCDVYRNSGWGVHVYAEGEQTTSGNVIRNNLVHDNGRVGDRGVGIGLYSGTGILAYDNVVWGNTTGIAVNYGAVGTGVYNNTVVGNAQGGISIGADSTGTIVSNNIVWNNAGEAIGNQGGATLGTNLTDVDPLFATEANFDFRLRHGSPAIDSGETLAAVTADIDGTARPQGRAYDLGAYEFLTDPCPEAGDGACGDGGHHHPGGDAGDAGDGGGTGGEDSGGCGCRTTTRPAGALAWVGLVAACASCRALRRRQPGKEER